MNNSEKKPISLGEFAKRHDEGSLSNEDREKMQADLALLSQKMNQVSAGFSNAFKGVREAVQRALKPSQEMLDGMRDFYDDSDRAKGLLGLLGDFSKLSVPEGIDILEREKVENGELTQRQLLLLIYEAGGLDTHKIAETLGSAGGKAKKGHKSDIRLALEEVVTITNDASYAAVRRYLSKSENWSSLNSIQVESCDLPTKSNGSGELKYNDSKDKTLTIKYGGVEKHLKDIRKTLDK